jgi:hypothetical protein
MLYMSVRVLFWIGTFIFKSLSNLTGDDCNFKEKGLKGDF